jgi:hypothetical protein
MNLFARPTQRFFGMHELGVCCEFGMGFAKCSVISLLALSKCGLAAVTCSAIPTGKILLLSPIQHLSKSYQGNLYRFFNFRAV